MKNAAHHRREKRGKDEIPKPVKWLILFIVGPLIAGLALLAIVYTSTFVSAKRAVDGYYTALERRDYARAFDYVREDYMDSQRKEKVSVEEARRRFVADLQRLEAEEGYRVLTHSAEIGLNPWEGHWASVTLTIQDRHGKRKVFENMRTYGSGKRGKGRLMIYVGREPSDPYLEYRGEQVPLGSQEAGAYGSLEHPGRKERLPRRSDHGTRV